MIKLVQGIYTVDGTKIAAAWGQDPSVAVAR